jgi:hypothetical protein
MTSSVSTRLSVCSRRWMRTLPTLQYLIEVGFVPVVRNSPPSLAVVSGTEDSTEGLRSEEWQGLVAVSCVKSLRAYRLRCCLCCPLFS